MDDWPEECYACKILQELEFKRPEDCPMNMEKVEQVPDWCHYYDAVYGGDLDVSV